VAEGLLVANQLTIRARGLATSGSDIDSPGANGLSHADNIVIDRENIYRPRRGVAEQAPSGSLLTGKTLDYIGAFQSNYLLHATDGSAFLWDGTTTSAPTPLQGGPFNAPNGGNFTSIEANLDLFLSKDGGLVRVDGTTGTTAPAGIAAGLDCGAALTLTDGTAIPSDTQVAYRAVFGTRDANGRLLLGTPSGRGVLQSPSLVAPVNTISRTSPSSTATVTIANHGLTAGENVILTGGDTNFPNGTFTVTLVTDANNFQFTSGGTSTVKNIVGCTFTRTPRNAYFSATVPAGLPNGAFYRIYRSLPSATSLVTPNDEMGLVVEAPVPTPATVTTLARTGTTVTATTSAPHAFTAGGLVSLSGYGGSSGQDVVVGLGTGSQRSTNQGASWASGGALSGTIFAIDWTGSTFWAAGDNVLASSATGASWSPTTVTGAWRNIVCGGPNPFVLAPGTSATSSTITSSCLAKYGDLSGINGSWGYWPGAGSGSTVSPVVAFSTVGGGAGGDTITLKGQYSTDDVTWTDFGTVTHTFSSSGSATMTIGTVPVVAGDVLVRVSVSMVGTGMYAVGQSRSASVPGPTLSTVPATGAAYYGSAWNALTLPEAYNAPNPSYRGTAWKLACWDGSRVVIVGIWGGYYLNYAICSGTSSDGKTWGTYSSAPSIRLWDYDRMSLLGAYGAPSPLSGIASDGAGKVIVVGRNLCMYSTDGANWTGASIPAGLWRSVAWHAPTARFVAVGNDCVATSPDGVAWTARTGLPSPFNMFSVVAEGNSLIAVGVGTKAYVSADGGLSWTGYTVPNGQYRAVSGSPSGIIGGTYPITTVADTTHFTFTTSVSGSVGPVSVNQQAVPVSVGIVDSVTTDMLGEAAYWNATQEGLQSTHDVPPDALDVATHRGFTFYAAPKRPPVLFASLATVSGSTALQVGDVVTVGGGTVTAAVAESTANNTFQVFTGGTSALNLFNTVQSLCRIINRGSFSVYAIQTVDASAPNPGQFALVSRTATSPVSISFNAHQPAWTPALGQTVYPSRDLNVIAYSLLDRLEAVPTLNTFRVGRADKAILRLVPLRDSLIIIKEDGIWRLTGTTPSAFNVQPLDLSVRIVAARTVAVLQNAIYGLSSAGFVKITDQGVLPVSLDIMDQLQPLLAPSMQSAMKALAFGIGYQSDNSYTVWTPSKPTDTIPTQAFTFHALTGQWTARTDSFQAALVSPTDDRLWAVGGSRVYRERKSLDRTDYADLLLGTFTATGVVGTTIYLNSVTGVAAGDLVQQGSVWANVLSVGTNYVIVDRAVTLTTGVASVQILKGIPCLIEWSPTYVSENASLRMQARENSLIFKHASFSSAAMSYFSDLSRYAEDVPMLGSALSLEKEPTSEQHRSLRVLVPREKQRCSQLNIQWKCSSAWADWQLEGISLTYEGGNEKVSK
jgi:hypothetical protein